MALMATFVAAWAAVEALAARVLREYSPYQVVFTRYVVHLALLLAVFGWRDPGALWRTRRPVYQLARSLLMLAMPASWIVATQVGIAPGTIASIFWLSPLLILGFARLVLDERPAPALWIATGVACAGAVVASRPGPPPEAARLLLPAAMAASFSLYVAMTRSLRSETTRANLFYTALGVTLALAAVMPRLWITPSPRDLLVMTGVGALGLVALWALDRMAAAAPVSKSAPLACLQLGFAFAIEVALRRARPDVPLAVALSAVALAALYAWVREPALTVA
jgi:drug/metabolite transporter (DMT)-like permease